ncbi:MAG: hypothetical protein FWD12_00140 [Alphaproteobacteria bacterium]|nr:hypothetical protein [Alphaproteobacteria bacterium]
MRRGLGVALLLLVALTGSASAMTLQSVPLQDGDGQALLLQGQIGQGDAARLSGALRRQRFAVIGLNSPGGSVVEARDMGRMINRLGVPVAVPDRGVCASACFMLFAAGRSKIAEPGAMIGVHSASVSGGNETLDTLGVTTLMAREAARYGVPASITGRMVTTVPGEMAWLSREELEGMGVRIGVAGAAIAGAVLPGSAAASKSDWTRGFERGRAQGEGGDCRAPEGIANDADFSLGCASGQRAAGARVAAASGPGGRSDWTIGFEYGRAHGAGANCDRPDTRVANPRDWSLGCHSGQRIGGS